MDEKSNNYVPEMINTLAEAWKLSLITAGMNAGIFTALNGVKPVTTEELADKLHYDPDKLDKWLYTCAAMGVVDKVDGGYVISERSRIFMPDTPYKDIMGFVRLNDYFMRAAVDAQNHFKKGNSLDKLTEGKITRNYQPNVSDNLSAAVINVFKRYSMIDGQSLLDVGCGIGAFSRTVLKNIPGLKITGMDPNLFAIEWGRKENRAMNLGDSIKLIVGDAGDDMEQFGDGSFDWTMAINVFHFFPVEKRAGLVENLIRVAKRTAFFTEVIEERTGISYAADPLMALLWSDYTGFFREKQAEDLNNMISGKFPDCTVEKYPILQNSSYVVAVTKP